MTTTLEILENNVSTKQPCGVCGEVGRIPNGPTVWEEGRPMCSSCEGLIPRDMYAELWLRRAQNPEWVNGDPSESPPTRARLVFDAASKPVRTVIQADGVAGHHGDMLSDADGDGITGGGGDELWRTGGVRILVADDVSLEDAERLIAKATALVLNMLDRRDKAPKPCPTCGHKPAVDLSDVPF